MNPIRSGDRTTHDSYKVLLIMINYITRLARAGTQLGNVTPRPSTEFGAPPPYKPQTTDPIACYEPAQRERPYKLAPPLVNRLIAVSLIAGRDSV